MPAARSTLRRLVHHPRTQMALKASVAATASWVVARNLPGGLDEYAYYAPLGAVSTTYAAVARSASAGVRTVVAIMLGAALGVLTDELVGPGLVAIALVVGLGVLLAGVPWLGENRSYVPVAGMFTLLIGQGEEIGYGAAYAGLFLVGAAFTIGINAALPALPVSGADRAIDRLRRACADHLDAIAAALDPAQPDVDAPDDALDAPGRDALTEPLALARAAVDEMREAARANRRARRNPEEVARRAAEFRALERAVVLVDDIAALSEDAPWGTTVGVLPDELRAPISAALRELAATLAETGLADTQPGPRVAADQAVTALAAALRRYEADGGSPAVALVVGTVVTTLRRSLSALTPAERIRLSREPLGEPGTPADTADGAHPPDRTG